jgi:glucuronate isomerase
MANSQLATSVFPAFRPDKAMAIYSSEFGGWIEKLSSAANIDIYNFGAFLEALRKRHDDFHAVGCRLSDHGLDYCHASPCSDVVATSIFDRARNGSSVTDEESSQFASFMMLFFARLDAEKGWTKQMHLGALRNVNSAARNAIGPDTGYDTVGDFPQIRSLAAYLDLLARENALPRMILYNNNPSDTFPFATLVGSFQDGTVPGKIQYGSAWWFLDQKEGITAQLNALSNVGLLSRFIGMVTDSRSFMSYPRHEYFRRILCDLVGQDVSRGELPNDDAVLGPVVQDICYRNARSYLNLPDVGRPAHQLK